MREIGIRDKAHFGLAMEILLNVSALVYTVIISNCVTISLPHNKRRIFKCFMLEYVVLILPIILYTTIMAKQLVFVNLVLLIIAIALLMLNKSNEEHLSLSQMKLRWTSKDHVSFISNCRGAVYLMTVICILAVDFKLFPIRFQKRKQYGVSLMDTGVGLFTCSMGVVAGEIRNYANLTIRKIVCAVIPLIVLGILRFLVTFALNYQVKTTEYGVHWNFFISLAVTRLCSGLILQVITPNTKSCLLLGIGVLSAHQYLLNVGLEGFVFGTDDRDSFIKANREGIISILGYIGLYFLSVSLGFLLQSKFATTVLINLVPLLGIITFTLHQLYDISRCLANSTYCSWILFLYTSVTLLFYCYEKLVKIWFSHAENMSFVPMLFDAINYNGLAFFLIGNLTTGVINLSLKTREIHSAGALVILFLYALFICACTVILSMRGIRLKL